MGTRYRLELVEGLSAWQELSLEFAERTRVGWMIARVAQARRFERHGTQLEVEAYPGTKRAYVFLSAAASGSEAVFVPLRLAVEPYVTLPAGWEASLGLRRFSVEGPDVLIYTGTVGKYVGNYWFSVRPSVKPDPGGGHSVDLRARRYFADGYDYLGLGVMYGSGINAETRDPARIASALKEYGVRVERRQPVRGSNARLSYGAGFTREETASAAFRRHVVLFGGVEWFWR